MFFGFEFQLNSHVCAAFPSLPPTPHNSLVELATNAKNLKFNFSKLFQRWNFMLNFLFCRTSERCVRRKTIEKSRWNYEINSGMLRNDDISRIHWSGWQTQKYFLSWQHFHLISLSPEKTWKKRTSAIEKFFFSSVLSNFWYHSACSWALLEDSFFVCWVASWIKLSQILQTFFYPSRILVKFNFCNWNCFLH